MSNRRLLQLLALVLVLVQLAACAPIAAPATSGAESTTTSSTATTLNVFAAASLTEAFGEIGAAFDAANPGVTTVFNFAGSNQLATQINEGAPADVFASANNTQMTVVVDAGGIDAGTPQTFVHNRLVVVIPADSTIALTSINDLATPGLKLVLAAPEVPVGQYSLDFLDKAASDPALGEPFKEAVLANLVSQEENVRAVLAKVVLGEADAGIVYSSDVYSAEGDVIQIEIPDALNTIANYPIAAVAESEHADLAQAFVDAVLSPEGQTILAKYGFIPAAE